MSGPLFIDTSGWLLVTSRNAEEVEYIFPMDYMTEEPGQHYTLGALFRNHRMKASVRLADGLRFESKARTLEVTQKLR